MTPRTRKQLLSAFFVLHFAALFLNSLPWSPFIALLYPKYVWYVRLTGQTQDWGMYTHPDHQRSHFALTAYYDDEEERDDRPWDVMARMDPRQLYFLEGLFVRSGRELAAERFLDRLLARYPADDAPVRIELASESWPLPGYGERAPAQPAEPVRREFTRYR